MKILLSENLLSLQLYNYLLHKTIAFLSEKVTAHSWSHTSKFRD